MKEAINFLVLSMKILLFYTMKYSDLLARRKSSYPKENQWFKIRKTSKKSVHLNLWKGSCKMKADLEWT